LKVDVLVAEIGSTTTVVNAFDGIDKKNPAFVGQGESPTTVLEGDVTVGLMRAVNDLKKNINAQELTWKDMLATSSAAGGLKMTVHGLVYDMTVRAAKEAALGAGGIIKMVTAGKLRKSDLKKIKEISPSIILVAGGVDYGERETAIHNVEAILSMGLKIPLIYAGNTENREEVRTMCNDAENEVFIVDNVYPKIDVLDVEPTRNIIQKVFEEHIVHAPGMTKVRELVNGPIIPTPGAVMEAAKILREDVGDLVIIDVGGATTDIHSVTDGTDEINSILLNPEPAVKRTVEGDLGVYVNRENVIERIGLENLKLDFPDAEKLIATYKPIPESKSEMNFVERLTLEAVMASIERHAGRIRQIYGISGRKSVAEGKDLTAVKYIIGTGGALTRLPGKKEILSKILEKSGGSMLYPPKSAEILIDEDYIIASLGVLSRIYPYDALILMKKSLRLI
jgi:uncharacterized protein (TIGR01319 family)